MVCISLGNLGWRVEGQLRIQIFKAKARLHPSVAAVIQYFSTGSAWPARMPLPPGLPRHRADARMWRAVAPLSALQKKLTDEPKHPSSVEKRLAVGRGYTHASLPRPRPNALCHLHHEGGWHGASQGEPSG